MSADKTQMMQPKALLLAADVPPWLSNDPAPDDGEQELGKTQVIHRSLLHPVTPMHYVVHRCDQEEVHPSVKHASGCALAAAAGAAQAVGAAVGVGGAVRLEPGAVQARQLPERTQQPRLLLLQPPRQRAAPHKALGLVPAPPKQDRSGLRVSKSRGFSNQQPP